MSNYAVSGPNKSYKSSPHVSAIKPRYIPLVAAVGLGVASYNYLNAAKSKHETMMAEEQKRLQKNQQLLDAYGRKDSLTDVQQALDAYVSR
ncbi:hypothetical protein N7495_007767 [Penicillium taxi]|uniref:uncharacterized protein n=1 Tax=Penicillium taxi TaxID=168475 RepID=UPI0025459415|nr:uncharacterized protein N7495_007767 [Penicillium taxi]KAJ5887726.1 hypothetical protein N7495_007767 [Penicillium taxi]